LLDVDNTLLDNVRIINHRRTRMNKSSMFVVVLLLTSGCRSNEPPRPVFVNVTYQAPIMHLQIRNAGPAGDIRIQLKNGSKEVEAITQYFQKDEERDVTVSLSAAAQGADIAAIGVWLNGYCYATLDLKTNKWFRVPPSGL
jgi:hypothetical protein